MNHISLQAFIDRRIGCRGDRVIPFCIYFYSFRVRNHSRRILIALSHHTASQMISRLQKFIPLSRQLTEMCNYVMAHLDGAIYHALLSSGQRFSIRQFEKPFSILEISSSTIGLRKVGVLYWQYLKFFCANLRQFLCCLYVDAVIW